MSESKHKKNVNICIPIKLAKAKKNIPNGEIRSIRQRVR